MQKAIEAIDDWSPNDIQKKIRKFQKESRIEREMAKKGRRINKQLKQAQFLDGMYEIRCHKCDAFGAKSVDIRKIEDSHHVIIDEGYGRWGCSYISCIANMKIQYVSPL